MEINKIYEILFILIKVTIIIVIFYVWKYFTKSKYFDDYSSSGVNKIKISIVILLKDNIEWIKYLKHKFDIIQKHYFDIFNFEYFIMENNSSDGTQNYHDIFMENKEGKFISEVMDLKFLKQFEFTDSISKNRGKLMAMLRNRLKKYHGRLDSKFTVMIDSDVYFDFNIFMKMIDVLRDNSIVMVTPFVTDFSDKFDGGYTHYYDTFALVTKNDIDFTKVGTLCLFKECLKCSKLRKVRDIHIDDKHLLTMDGDSGTKLIEVKCAFGSFAMIRTDVYNKVDWDDTICEHLSFCEKVRKFGKIVIATDIKITNSGR